MNHILTQHLDPVVRRIRRRHIAVSLAAAWTIAAVICIALLVSHRMENMTATTLITTCSLVIATSSIIGAYFAWSHRRKMRTYYAVAQQIENEYPDLDSKLLTAIEQTPSENQSFDFLQQEVIRSAVYHDYQHGWEKIVPRWQTIAAPMATCASLLLVIATFVSVFLLAGDPPPDPDIMTFNNVSASNFDFTVEPGNTSVEAGKSLLVIARFSDKTPPTATLKYSDAAGRTYEMEMKKSLSDPIFAARIEIVDSALDYFVQIEGQRSDVFRADVFEFPKLKRADAHLEFPAYTKLTNKTVQDVRRISAVVGTNVDLSFSLNKSVQSATLVSRDNQTIELQQSDQDPSLYTTKFKLNKSERYELRLVDAASRENVSPPRFSFNALPNNPPKIKIVAPGRDVQVSPLEELLITAEVWDDYGVTRAGISHLIPGHEPTDLVLVENIAGKQTARFEKLVEFEELKARADQLLTYYIWAEDIGPDGNVRRTSSDMYFAEVRPFEEIFRQGQQPNAQQQRQQNQQQRQAQQNAQQAEQMAKSQKEIINATWRIIRRELDEKPSDKFASDTKLVLQSQQQQIQKVDALAQRLTNANSKAFAEEVKSFMNHAITHLRAAVEENDPKKLAPALAAEQSAYQSLLKLRDREHQVVRNNQRQQSQQQQNQRSQLSQQQLQQLQLEKDENRYETQRQAQRQAQESKQKREDRQILNRLRELARRQNDLNKRIKELQSALEQAKNEQERKEIEKQLKRLQQEQEQVLRDTDELADRMNQPENQQRMNEQSKQLEQARENARKSAESLEKGEVSRAAAEGSRAQKELEELRDEFQKRTSKQFSKEMRDMRNQAQDLDKKQKQIRKQIEQLDQPNKQPQKSLDEKDKRKQLIDDLDDQKKRLDQIKKSMRKTIEESEQDQPLLAQQLYDTYRKNQQSQTDRALDETRRSIQQGWNDDAKNIERRAAEGIENLKKGIEKAAESILGDPAESLRRANSELEQLKRDLESEIDRNDPRQSNESRNNERRPRGDEKSNRKTGPRGKQNSKKSGDGKSKSDSKSKTDAKGKSNGRSKSQGKRDGKDDQKNNRGQGKSDGKNQKKSGQPRGKGKADGKDGKQRDGDPNSSPNNPDNQSGNRDGSNNRNRPNRDQRDNNQRPAQPRSLRDDPNGNRSGNLPPLNRRTGNDDRNIAPLTGKDFRDWSDRLRDVEELVNDPELRAEAARLRDRAKAIRKDFQRHSKDPNWDLVRMKLFEPLVDLQDRVRRELIRRSNKKSTVPLDRAAVPPEFEEAVRRYYKEIGSGK